MRSLLPRPRHGKRPLGVVLYRGPSMLDGAPIMVIATFRSENDKTGPMIQTWILRADIPPIAAISDGADVSICGDCPLRGSLIQVARGGHPLGASAGECSTCVGRACYVRADQAPTAVYWAARRGRYPDYVPAIHARYFRGATLRLGSYGDPVAVPIGKIRPLVRLSAGHTGYSHSWRLPRFKAWRALLHASTHNTDESLQAIAQGWKVFQVSDECPEFASWCPSSRGVHCADCRACRGSSGGNRCTRPHGSPATVESYRRAVTV
jgi:hypothetical protein